MEYRWSYEKADERKVQALYSELKINKMLCEILVKRGIETFDQAKHFFRPSLDHLHDPFLMQDMDKAVDRIEMALELGEKLMIYGDYDVDGTTAVSLVYGFFKSFYDDIIYYIPDRYKEGYGVSFKGIDVAAEEGVSLIIALDCGIKAIEKVAYAKEKGIDFIICDHHRPGDELPPAIAILDAKRNDCTYPYDELCGCGVGFKLLQAFAKKNAIPFDYIEKQLDLLAVSIGSDIVPITGENRTLAYFGLQKINRNPRRGLAELIELSGMTEKEMTITDVVFTIGPRINAAGRLESGNKAVDLLLSETDGVAAKAMSINTNNKDRQSLDRQITQEALELIQGNPKLIEKKTTVLHQSHWHKGVIGIVASRVMETYYRPTIILTTSNGKIAGSARSVKGFDVYNALLECSDCMLQFGGHKYAAGMTMTEEQLPLFIEKFEAVVAASIEPDMLIPEINIDAPLELVQITPKFFDIVEQMAPFGPKNMRPVFCSRGVRDTGWSKIVGQDQTHVKFHISQNGSTPIGGIGFGLAKKFHIIKNGAFDICYQIDTNTWNGNTSLQLKVKDIKPSAL